MRGSLLREPRFRLSSRSSAGALEEDNESAVSLDRLGSTSKNSTEISERSVWIGYVVLVVGPRKFSAIINRIERNSASTSEGVRNLRLHNFWVEDVGSFVRSRVVRRIDSSQLTGSNHIRHLPCYGSSRNTEPRCEVVNQVVETTEGLLDTERCDQLGYPSVVVTYIIAESCFSLKLVGCLGGHNRREYWPVESYRSPILLLYAQISAH